MRLSRHWLLGFLLLPIVLQGQTKWTTIHLDENLSFTIPSEYKKKDTLGQKTFLARTDYAFIQAVKIPQPQAKINNENELIGFYKAFENVTIDQGSGDLVSDTTIESNDLLVRVFKFETFWNDSLEIQENTIAFIDHSIYSFTYAYFKDQEQLAKVEKEIFFSGITFHETDFKDQLTIQRNKNEEAGEFVGYIMQYVTAAIVLLAIVLFFLKKYQLVKSIINFLSLAFLTMGATSVFFYLVNLLIDNNLNLLLIGGTIFLTIGFLLRKIKITQIK